MWHQRLDWKCERFSSLSQNFCGWASTYYKLRKFYESYQPPPTVCIYLVLKRGNLSKDLCLSSRSPLEVSHHDCMAELKVRPVLLIPGSAYHKISLRVADWLSIVSIDIKLNELISPKIMSLTIYPLGGRGQKPFR